MHFQTVIEQYFAGNEVFFRRFVGQFLQDAPPLLAQIETTISQGKCSDAALHLHTLKGQLGYLGQEALVATLQRLEQLADQQKLPNLQPAWKSCREEIDALMKRLARFI